MGRSVEEALRLIDAFQFVEKYGEVCPANWQKGQQGMKATKDGYTAFIGNKPQDTSMANGSEISPSGSLKAMTNGH